MDDFQNAFNDADIVFVTPVYAGRRGADRGRRFRRACRRPARARPPHGQGGRRPRGAGAALRDLAAEGDMIICMGAGDITKWAAGLADGIAQSEERRSERRSRRLPKVRGQADRRTRRWRRWCGSRAAATPNGCSSRPTSTIWPNSCASSIPTVPVMALGLGSNLIVRDGGVPGVVVRLGKPFAKIEQSTRRTLRCGGGASGILVSSTARDAGIAGLEFLRGDPRHGRRLRADERRRLWPRGQATCWSSCDARAALGRDRGMAADATSATAIATANCPKARWWSPRRFAATPASPPRSAPRWTASPPRARKSQPLRSRTGGSTFKNPPGHKAWALIDAAGCRGLTLGGAQVSEKHCNFLLNLGSATSADIEALGEEVRRRVEDQDQHRPRMGNPAGRAAE